MCLILFAYRQVPGIRLIALANRDEFYDRPTKAAHSWPDHQGMVAGQDLQSGGTWLGVRPNGRLAAITNYRDGLPKETHPASRGHIPLQFLASVQSPEAFITELIPRRHEYGDFNVLLHDETGLWHYCSATNEQTKVQPGVHGLSNQTLNSPWPKVMSGTWDLAQVLDEDFDADKLLNLMYDTHLPDDMDLPDTGVGLDWERTLAPLFIQSPDYGTRSTTLVIVYESGRIEFVECSHDAPSNPQNGEEQRQIFELNPA